MTYPLVLLTTFFHRKSKTFVASRNTDIECILMHNNSFNFFWVVVLILMMSAKLVTLHLLKIKVSWNNGYAVTISVCHVTNKVLSPDSNYIVDVVMWLTFGSFSVSMREAIITSNTRNLSLRVPVEWFGSGTSLAKR